MKIKKSFVVQSNAFKTVVTELMKDDEKFNPNQQFKNNQHRYKHPLYSLNLDQFRDCGVLASEK
jgi:Tfp pilus assembly protein PilP